MTGCDHLLYGSDCGVPCTTDATKTENLHALLNFPDLDEDEIQSIGRNALRIFPHLAERLDDAGVPRHAHAPASGATQARPS